MLMFNVWVSLRQVFAFTIAITNLMNVDAVLYVMAFYHDFVFKVNLWLQQGEKLLSATLIKNFYFFLFMSEFKHCSLAQVEFKNENSKTFWY